MSNDPIGLAGGNNLYQYAANPTGWIDPLGWASFTPVPLTEGTVYRQGSGSLTNEPLAKYEVREDMMG